MGELFANVCVHTDTAWIEIRITCDGDVLHVEVIDDGQRKPTSPMREGGRGFQIVGALTLGWGITYGSYTAAWFTMKASPE